MNEQIIWGYLYSQTENAYGTAAIMGNLFCESSLDPKCRTGNTKLAKDRYTELADSGAIDFVNDNVAYGLAQWRYWSRKNALLTFARERGTSVGDMGTQLAFLMDELPKYKTVYKAVITATDIREPSDLFMEKYERPGNTSEKAKEKRSLKAWEYYGQFHEAEKQKIVKVTVGNVNLRRGNGVRYSKVTLLPNGTKLNWVATADNGWHAVEYDNKVFWVSGEFTEVV